MGHKALVVGGAGFLGRELCRQLLAGGNKVTAIGRGRCPVDLKVNWLQLDITDPKELFKNLEGLRFDVVYHAASLPGDTGNPVEMVQTNLLGLTGMLQFARESGVDHFVLSSSISAYEWYPATRFAPPSYLPVDEEHPLRPKDMYASTKRMQEILAMTFYHQYQVPVTILRITAIIGPDGRGGGRGWRAIAEQLKQGRTVQIPHFSLEEVCHYVDLRDAARMHIVSGTQKGAIGEIFNCCGPVPISGQQFAEVIKKHFPGIQVETGFPWSMAQGGRLFFDMSKAKKLLQYEPIYSVEDSILSMKEWISGGGLDQSKPAGTKKFGAGVQIKKAAPKKSVAALKKKTEKK